MTRGWGGWLELPEALGRLRSGEPGRVCRVTKRTEEPAPAGMGFVFFLLGCSPRRDCVSRTKCLFFDMQTELLRFFFFLLCIDIKYFLE